MITSKAPVNDTTSTFTFTSIDNEPVTNLKLWYNDPSMIGRHFLVYSVQAPNVKRHYTICSTMQPAILAELISMAENKLQDRPIFFSTNKLEDRDQSQLNLTMKNYQTKRGLATKIHSTHLDEEAMNKNQIQFEELSTENAYYVKGPMGKGLQIQPSGVHVAFCAGTGALVFLDLVAHLLLKNCFESDGKKLPNEMAVMYQPTFAFHFYCSFQDRDQAIGLDVIEKLEQVN